MFRTFDQPHNHKFTFGKFLLFLISIDILAIVSLIVLSLFPQFYRKKDMFLETTFTLNIILIGLFLISAVNYIAFKGKKKSKLEGTLDLKENEIVVNNEVFPLSEVQKIRFIGNDVKGEFRGFVTKGIQNQLIVTTKNGKETQTYFEQTIENNLRDYKKVLETYFQKGILSEANYENILNNTNYY